MTPENRILHGIIFSESNTKLHNELIDRYVDLLAENDVFKASNTELKDENEKLIALVEKVEQESHDYQIRLKQLAWDNSNPKSEESATSLELAKVVSELTNQNKVLQEEREKFHTTIKRFKEDSQHWYKEYMKSQDRNMAFILENRALRENLKGDIAIVIE